MDKLKQAVCDAVTKLVNDSMGNLLSDALDDHVAIEVHDVSPTLNMVRVSGLNGGPRYFNIKVSEQM